MTGFCISEDDRPPNFPKVVASGRVSTTRRILTGCQFLGTMTKYQVAPPMPGTIHLAPCLTLTSSHHAGTRSKILRGSLLTDDQPYIFPKDLTSHKGLKGVADKIQKELKAQVPSPQLDQGQTLKIFHFCLKVHKNIKSLVIQALTSFSK